MNSEISKLSYINPPVYTWFASFNNFLLKGQSWSDVCGSNDLDQYTYEEKLRKFLEISITSPCCQSYGICGEQYSSDMQFGEDGKLVSTRLRVMHRPLRNSYDYIRSAREMRLAVQYVMGPLLEQDSTL
jgi:Niemann-Pick C1 protein